MKERNCNRGNAQFLKKPKDFIFSGRGPKFVYPSASTSALLLSSSSGSGGGAYPTDRFYIAEQSPPIGSPAAMVARPLVASFSGGMRLKNLFPLLSSPESPLSKHGRFSRGIENACEGYRPFRGGIVAQDRQGEMLLMQREGPRQWWPSAVQL